MIAKDLGGRGAKGFQFSSMSWGKSVCFSFSMGTGIWCAATMIGAEHKMQCYLVLFRVTCCVEVLSGTGVVQFGAAFYSPSALSVSLSISLSVSLCRKFIWYSFESTGMLGMFRRNMAARKHSAFICTFSLGPSSRCHSRNGQQVLGKIHLHMRRYHPSPCGEFRMASHVFRTTLALVLQHNLCKLAGSCEC